MNPNIYRALALPIAIGIVPYASASDYFCRSVYDTKLERIEKNRGSRNFSNTAGIVAVAASSIAAPIIWISSSAGGILLGVLGGGIGGAALGGGIVNLFDREDGLVDAKTLLDQAQMSREDLRQTLYNRLIEQKMSDVNSDRAARKIPLITRPEVESTFKPMESLNLYSAMDLAYFSVNDDRRKNDLQGYTYAQFQDKVLKLMDTDQFCPMRSGKNRPMTYRKVLKIIKR